MQRGKNNIVPITAKRRHSRLIKKWLKIRGLKISVFLAGVKDS